MERLVVLVVGVITRALGDHKQVQVVLQIRTDAGHVMGHAQPQAFQMCARTDTGLHQQLGRTNGSGRNDHLPVGPHRLRGPALADHQLHADRPLAFEQDLEHL